MLIVFPLPREFYTVGERSSFAFSPKLEKLLFMAGVVCIHPKVNTWSLFRTKDVQGSQWFALSPFMYATTKSMHCSSSPLFFIVDASSICSPREAVDVGCGNIIDYFVVPLNATLVITS